MNPWKGLKGLPREMWIIFFTTLINRSGTMVLPFLILYLTREEKFTPAVAGFVLFVYGVGALLQAPFSGKLSDKIGKLRILKFSLFFSGIILFIFAFVRNYYLIFGMAFIWSVISESFRPAGLSLISEVVPSQQRKTAFALNRLSVNIGMSIGPVLGGILAQFNFSYLFYVDGATCILAAFFLIFSGMKEPPSNMEETGSSRQHFEGMILKDKTFLIFLAGIFPIAMIFFQHLGAMVLFIVNKLHHAPSVFGFLMSINTMMIILIEVPLNNSISKMKDKTLLSAGALFTGAGFGLMALTTNLTGIVFSIIIWTFGEMIFFPASASYIAEISPSRRRGEYMGFYQMTFSTAFALGPWLGTKIYESFGSQILWSCTFVVGLIAFLIFHFSHPKNLVAVPDAVMEKQ